MREGTTKVLTRPAAKALTSCHISVRVRPAPHIDSDAAHLLQQMSAFLAAQQAFSLQATVDKEVVLPNDQKLQITSEASVNVKRPDSIRVLMDAYYGELEVTFDGNNISILDKNGLIYYKFHQIGDLDSALDKIHCALHIDTPGIDLFYSDVFSGLTTDAQSGRVVDREVVDGVVCNHLAFRTSCLDWQIWIAQGPAPVPHKYVITSKWMPSAPTYSVRLHHWNFCPRFEVAEFIFVPPRAAVQAKSSDDLWCAFVGIR